LGTGFKDAILNVCIHLLPLSDSVFVCISNCLPNYRSAHAQPGHQSSTSESSLEVPRRQELSSSTRRERHPLGELGRWTNRSTSRNAGWGLWTPSV